MKNESSNKYLEKRENYGVSLRSKKKEDYLGLKRMKRDFITISKAKQDLENKIGFEDMEKIEYEKEILNNLISQVSKHKQFPFQHQ